jgi:hypothetical protein
MSVNSDRLFYYGTVNDIRLGDRVSVRPWLFGWLRTARTGVVCYIPGDSPPRNGLENEWLIRYDDSYGSIDACGYFPKQFKYASKSISLISRGAPAPLRPDEVGDGEGEEEGNV